LRFNKQKACALRLAPPFPKTKTKNPKTSVFGRTLLVQILQDLKQAEAGIRLTCVPPSFKTFFFLVFLVFLVFYCYFWYFTLIFIFSI